MTQLPDQQPNEVPVYGIVHHDKHFHCIYPGDYVVEWADGQAMTMARAGFEAHFTVVEDVNVTH